MKITLSIICDALSKYNPTLVPDNIQYDELCIDSENDFYIVPAAQLDLDAEECRDKILFVIGAALTEKPHNVKSLIIMNTTDITQDELRSTIYSIKTKYDTWSNKLLYAIIDELGLLEFLKIGSEMFPCPICIENLYGQIMAESAFSFSRPEKDNQKRNSSTFFIMCNSKRFALFKMIESETNITNGQKYVAKYFVSLLEMYFSNLHSKGVESGYTAALISQLIDGTDVDRSFVEFYLSKLGWNTNDKFCVIAVDHKETEINPHYLTSLSFEIKEKFPKMLFYSDNKKIFLILNLKNYELYEDLLTQLDGFAQTHGLYMGISSLFSDFMHLKRYCDEATYVINKASNDVFSCHVIQYESVQEFYLEEYLLSARDDFGDIIDSQIEKLYYFDQGSNQQYIKALYSYILRGSNLSSAARALYIDRNTLLYRLNKISEIIGHDIVKETPNSSTCLYYLISCYLALRKDSPEA